MTKHKTISIYVSWLNKRHWSDARRTVVNPKSLLSIWRVSELVSLCTISFIVLKQAGKYDGRLRVEI